MSLNLNYFQLVELLFILKKRRWHLTITIISPNGHFYQPINT